MTNCGRGLGLGLAVVVLALTLGHAQEAKGPAKEVLALAQEAEAGKDIAAQAAAMRKRFANVRTGMRLYNSKNSGGIGFGPKGHGIESRLVDLGEKGVSADTLKKEAAELTRVAYLNMVVAEITRGFAPEKPFLGRGKKEWESDIETVKSGSQSLLQAIKAGDPRAAQVAATRINNACDRCHDGAR